MSRGPAKLHHAVHSAHTTAAHRLILLWQLRHHGFGRDHQPGDRCGILQGGTHDLGRIENAGLDHVGELAGRGVVTEITLFLLDLVQHHRAFSAGVDDDLAQGFFHSPPGDADAATGEILISAVAKLSDRGQFKGAFGGDISLKTISDTINTLDFNGAGYAFLLSRSGNIISHPNAEYNGKSYSELFDGHSPALGKELHEVEADGKSLLVSFTPLPNLRGMDWYIGVVLDESVVMAEANRLTWLAVVGTVVGVAISLVVLGLLMNSLLKPLSLLSTSLREINSGEGDLTRRLAITSNDEIGELTEEFKRFLQTLQTLIGAVMGGSPPARGSAAPTSTS